MIWSFTMMVLARCLNNHVPKCFCLQGWMVKDPVWSKSQSWGLSSRTQDSGRGLWKRGRRSQPGFIAQPQLHGRQGQGTSHHHFGPSCPSKIRAMIMQSICCHMAADPRQAGTERPTTLPASCPNPCSEEHPSLPLSLTVLPLTWWLALVSRGTVSPPDGNPLLPSWSRICSHTHGHKGCPALAGCHRRGVTVVTTVCTHGTMSSLAPKLRWEPGRDQEGDCKQPSWGDSDVSKASLEAQTLSQGWWRNVTIPLQITVFHRWANVANAKCRIPASSSPPSCTFTTLWSIAWAVTTLWAHRKLHLAERNWVYQYF